MMLPPEPLFTPPGLAPGERPHILLTPKGLVFREVTRSLHEHFEERFFHPARHYPLPPAAEPATLKLFATPLAARTACRHPSAAPNIGEGAFIVCVVLLPKPSPPGQPRAVVGPQNRKGYAWLDGDELVGAARTRMPHSKLEVPWCLESERFKDLAEE